MGLMDKVKGLVKGRERQVKQGIDVVSNKIEQKVGAQHAAKVDDVSHKAKQAVDKLAATGKSDPTPPVTPPETPPV